MSKRTNTATWLENQGRWQINVQKDGVRRTFTSSKPGRTGQREANAKADKWLDDGVTGGILVSALWEDYLNSVQQSSGTSNYVNTNNVGRNYILPKIGHLKIEKVTENHLQNILDEAYKHGSFAKDVPKARKLKEGETLSRKTLKNIFTTINAFMKYCRVRRKCTTLFPESLSIPSGARYKNKDILQSDALTILFKEDFTLYRGKKIFDNYIYAYRFMVATGLRPGEIVGLKYSDITGGEIRVSRSVNVYGETTQGKNQNAVRSFYLPPLAQEAYNQQIAMLKANKIKLSASTNLFQIEKERHLYDAWKRYCIANNIPSISLYEMRHTFVSISKQLPEGTVKSLVGHSKNMDTFGIYGHQISGEAEQTAKAVGELFDKIIK